MSVSLVKRTIGDFERLDLGWRTADGDFGWLGPLPTRLSELEISELFHWADSTRSAFGQHWYCVSLGTDKRALIRVSPLPGGERGTASTVQVIVLPEESLGWCQDVSDLFDAFPPPPTAIGKPADWDCRRNPIVAPATEDRPRQLTPLSQLSNPHSHEDEVRFALDALLRAPPVEAQRVALPMLEHREPTQQIQFALRVYLLIPPVGEARGRIALASENAPDVSRQRYVVQQTDLPPDPGIIPSTDILLALVNSRWRDSVANSWTIADSLPRTIAASLLVRPEPGFQSLLAFSRLIASGSAEVRSCWQNAVESEIFRIDPDSQYRLLDSLLSSASAVEEYGYPPAWAARMLVSTPGLFNIQPHDDFRRNVAVMARWFPARLAQRIRERGRPLSTSEINTLIDACRAVVNVRANNETSVRELDSISRVPRLIESASAQSGPIQTPTFDSSQGELLRVALEISLFNEDSEDSHARVQGAELLLDCSRPNHNEPFLLQLVKEVFEKVASSDLALARVLEALAHHRPESVMRFMPLFEPRSVAGKRTRVLALLRAGSMAIRNLPIADVKMLQLTGDPFTNMLTWTRTMQRRSLTRLFPKNHKVSAPS